MESQPKNPEIRINPENFHPCDVFLSSSVAFVSKQDAHRISPNFKYSCGAAKK